MTNSEREELEQLKRRQGELADCVHRLSRDIEALEARVNLPEPVVRLVPKPVIEAPPIIAPAPAPCLVETVLPVAPPEAVPVLSIPAAAAIAPSFAAIEPPPLPVRLPECGPIPTAPVARGSFELQLGTYWLVRIGIVMILSALGLVGLYAYQHVVPHLGRGGKVGLLYAASGLLAGMGAWLQRKQDRMKNYGQVLLAGGLAAIYFTTYAAYHIPNLQIIPNAVVDGVLLLVCAGGIVALADRQRSEVLALFAVVLAYYTSVITNVGLFTLYSNLVLTLAAIFFLIRHRWATLSFASLVGTYLSYAFWRFYAGGHWHLVSPEEGLWQGNIFLLSYWVLFTVAVFWSASPDFAGTRRAGFVSLNNGAFFTAFLVTMWQVNTGRFYVFAFGYGGVLLALAALAWRFRREDGLFRNTYLTQGVLLVTLGCLSYFAGLHLSLVLACESILLVVLGRQLQSRVLRAASFPAAALAVFWCVTMVEPFNKSDLGSAVCAGLILLLGAFLTRDEAPLPNGRFGPRGLFYTTGAMIIWLVATWQNTTAEWRAVSLTAESAIFLLASRPLGNGSLRWSSLVFGSLGTLWQLVELGEIYFRVTGTAQRTGYWSALITGALLIGNALVYRRVAPPVRVSADRPAVTIFSVLGLVLWLGTTLVFVSPAWLSPVLAAEAAGLTAAYYLLRLRETAMFGQVFLVVAQVVWLARVAGGQVQPWWNPALVIAFTLGLAQWWQRQRSLVLEKSTQQGLQIFYATGAVVLLYFWLQPQFGGAEWLALSALLAVALTVYGAATRSWWVAAVGQAFSLVSVVEFARQLSFGRPSGWCSILPVAVLLGLSLATVQWLRLRPVNQPGLAGSLLNVSRVYRSVAAVMFLGWVETYVPANGQCLMLAVLGLGLFLGAGIRGNREMLIFSGVYGSVAVLRFWWGMAEGSPASFLHLLGLLGVPLQQQLARRKADRYPLVAWVHNVALLAGGLSLWLWLSRWVDLRSGGFYLTASWSALALVIFLAGMALRERVYRWLGLGILAVALGRGLLIDMRTLELIYRILSVLALGIVLLVLGFLYNKYQERLKEWL